MVMDHFGVEEDRQTHWWGIYKRAVSKGIANQQVSVGTSIKKAFMGK